MREGIRSSLISFLLFSTASISAALSIKTRSYPLGIDWDPAPAPQDGPPLSVGALRDPAFLPAEIVGIVGSYVFIVCVVGISLILISRHIRRVHERFRQEPNVVELIQPRVHNYPPPLSPASPTSPRKNFSYPTGLEKSNRTPYIYPAPQIHSPQSPGTDPNVDAKVVEADREMLQRDLEDIYTHVMEQEEAKANGVVLTEPPPPLQQHMQKKEPVPAASPQRGSKKIERPKPTNIDIGGSREQKTQSRASSIISSLMSPKRKGVRSLQISSPIPTPMSSTFPADYASDEEPLSPRHYSPPPPPPVPKDQVPYRKPSHDDITPASPTRSIAEQLALGSTSQHKPHQSTSSIQSTCNPLTGNPTNRSANASKVSLPTSPRASLPASPRPDGKFPKPTPLNPSVNNSTRTLPFRAYDPPGSLNSPSLSQTTTKTTVLERTAPLSPGLRTPWTAGAMPYSPYQPFTPLVPVTPTLVTKEHRKMMKKREKRIPVLEMVSSADELWDSGY
jgi:hypothetical protein